MSDLVSSDPALSVFFTFELDSDAGSLGTWTTCSGLGMAIDTEARGDSALSFMMHQLSGKMTYTNLTLGRPVSPATASVMAWMQSYSTLPVTTTASLTALDPGGTPIMEWGLIGVVPVRWTGPSFDAANLSVATEQLEIAYQGFL